MDAELFAKIVNSFAGALVSVCKSMGVDITLDKLAITSDVSVAGSRVAALIGFVTTAVKGTVAVMADETSFNRIVIAMSGGNITPKLGDPLSMSVLGELANMTSGQAFIKLSEVEGLNLTPPQLLVGEHIKSIPPKERSTQSFTLPFKLDGGGILYMVLTVS
ncbi:MAG: chemotaxis protein CheX [Acetomicrobium sp.]|jgi:chemotaxis protein CheX|uniref:chemotaxis protein CheX n=1 Tax=Acetomicrobium sp. TaxID=1872099 RepID=UPI001B584112|nr:chemotaxis protein CheX [Acetomicrobium sp.]MBP8675396.1 chemotaxis protein CheX [Acetomicrobium sp.]HPT65366.1 chemotaxis protein CheX [Acetomicrobium sp.]HXK99044.1 chemotaxis protein CheX [Acetomicrobium sp.]